MTRKTCKGIRTFLLIIASLVLLYGLSRSIWAGQERARDVTKIKVEIQDKTAYFSEGASIYSNGSYYVDFEVEIKNGTATALDWMSVRFRVFDKSGEELGVIDTQYAVNADSGRSLKPGKKVTMTTQLKENRPDSNPLFVQLYMAELSDLKFEYEVISVQFAD